MGNGSEEKWDLRQGDLLPIAVKKLKQSTGRIAEDEIWFTHFYCLSKALLSFHYFSVLVLILTPIPCYKKNIEQVAQAMYLQPLSSPMDLRVRLFIT